MAFRIDRATLTGLRPPQVRADGSVLYDAIVSKPGVYEYELTDGSTRREWRPEDEVMRPDSLETLQMGPVVAYEHTPKGRARYESVGTVGQDVRWDAEQGGIRCSVVVRDDDAIRAVANGMRELSCGYDVELEETPGVTESGDRYDAIQRGPKGADGAHGPIVYEHLAIVPSGRQGSSVSLRADASNWRTDSAIMIPASSGADQPAGNRNEGAAMADKSKTSRTDCGDMGGAMPPEKKVDAEMGAGGGVEGEAAPMQAAENDELAKIKQALAMAMQEIAKLKGERDGAVQAVDAEKEKQASAPPIPDESRMDAAVARSFAKRELATKARTLGVEVRADAALHEIQAAIVNRFSKDQFKISADDAKQAAYVQGRYDAISERIDAANAAEATARSAAWAPPQARADGKPRTNPIADAFAAQQERNAKRSQGARQ